MIISMTGYGRAELTAEDIVFTAEVRSVNTRYLNIKQRLPEGLMPLEVHLERLIRSRISRGMITLFIKAEPTAGAASLSISREALKAYLREIEEAKRDLNIGGEASIDALLSLPGVVAGAAEAVIDADAVRAQVEKVVSEALARLDEMRHTEGRATEEAVRRHCEDMRGRLAKIAKRAPLVVEEYQKRLRERAQRLLADTGLELANEEVIKEIALFAERSDISEELTRLASHIEQFGNLLDGKEPVGRRLEFLTQEMHREANTIGAKASDIQISQQVLEIKANIDRLREQVENVQ